jgi:hypothetical protein
LFDLHGELRCTFAERTAAGFPAPAAVERLRRVEDELTERFAGEALLALDRRPRSGVARRWLAIVVVEIPTSAHRFGSVHSGIEQDVESQPLPAGGS